MESITLYHIIGEKEVNLVALNMRIRELEAENEALRGQLKPPPAEETKES